ncbi:MAG: starch-binding protein [Muribaculaceae bacterium]|nr:starch-binding protein [Muribaculaceae bacterium]
MNHNSLWKSRLGLAVLLAVAAAFTIRADITIKVMKGGTAPYLYAWDSNEQPLNGAWPGTQMTDRDADGNWMTTVPTNESTVNIIFNNGNGNQTGNILNVPGVDGVAKFTYDGNSTWFSVMPNLNNSEGYIYFNCPPDWGNSPNNPPYIHFLNSNEQQLGSTGWPGYQMEYEGLDGAGFHVYRYYTASWSGIYKLIFNCGSSAHQTGNLLYVANGYYNTNGSLAQLHALNTANGYTDANFRAGIAAQLGINDGSVFMPNEVTYLDVSNCNISSLAGISNFTNLQTLIANHNNISRVDLGSNAKLEVLDLSYNSSSLIGPSQSSGAGHITFAQHTPLTYLDLSNNSGLTYFSAIYNTYGINTLQTLILANTPLGWPSAITHQPDLTYLDLSNSSQTGTVNLTALTKLEYLDLSDNSSLTVANFTYPSSLSTLKTLKLNNCDKLSVNSTNHISLAAFTALETLEFSNVDFYPNSILSTFPASAKGTLKHMNLSNDLMVTPSFADYTALETFDLSGNTTMTEATITGCPALQSVDVSGNTKLATLTMNNDNLSDLNVLTGLDECTKLETVDLNENVFTSIPDMSGNSVKYLKLRNNQISGAVTFTGNTTLQGLDITGNSGITSLNASNNALTALMLGGMTNCTTLNLSGCSGLTSTCANNNDTNLKSGAGRVYMADLTALTDLNVSNCNIRGTTSYNWMDVSSLSNLTNINASGNTANGFTCWQGAHLPAGIKQLDLSDCTGLYANRQLDSLTTTQKQAIEVFNLSNTGISVSTVDIEDYTALKTLDISDNPNMNHALTLNGCTALESVDVTGDTSLPRINLTNCGLTNSSTLPLIGANTCTSLAALDLSNNAYTSVPALNLPASCTSLYMNSNALTGIALPSGSPVQFLYAENNGFNGALELTASSTASLKGLDLGNNGITTFKAEGTTLSALMLGNNPNMTTLELHGNDNLTCTTAGTTMSDGSGLYIKGNTSLQTIDLSNSSFNQIGANAALQGLTAVETLNGSHNKFTTFTNSNYDNGDRHASYVAGKSSLEHLTGLKRLDLSYNELADSVHLYRNTQLEYLDVSHNNVIGPLATTDAEKLAMRLKKVDLLRKYHCKDTPIGISCPAATQATLDANEATTHRAFDLRDIDLRDTTGLFHLDLNYNVELKYLDISETNIHNTAAGWWYMNPGWEYGTGGWYSYVDNNHPGTKSPANGSTRHHFVWLQTCGKLEEFHADNNNMQSLGVRTSPYLHTITAKGMYGDCWLMRDAGTSANPDNLTEKGNISISGSVVTYSRTAYKTNTDGTLSGTVYYKDADGVEGGTNYYPNPVKWYDVSNSGYYGIRTANGVVLEHLDVSGNHLSELKVSGNTKLQYVDTENNDRLTYVDANDLPDLDTLKVANNPVLEKLYADNDPSLPFITGLDDCSALKYLHVQNNGLFGSNDFNVEANTNLQSLLAYNCNLPGELKVSQCAAMDTLCCNDNVLTKLDVSSLANMHWLDCYNNSGITELVPGTSTGMTHLDLHNCSVLDLDVAPNTAMRYFDCDNNHIRELDFAGAAAIDTIHANSNNLFQLNLTGPHTSLADLQFEHNHINGIDLSGCQNGMLTASAIKDSDNGRTIVANCSMVDGNPMYYFQLQDVDNGGFLLDSSNCNEDNEQYGRHTTATLTEKTLAQDGFVQSQVTWSEAPFVGSRRSRASDLGLVADKVIGTIVVLKNTSTDPDMGSGTETYQYDNGISQSEFYLNWTADADIITATDDISTDEMTIEGGSGCIIVTVTKDTTITIHDMAGRTIAQRDLEAGTTSIDDLQPGIYIVAGHKVAVK